MEECVRERNVVRWEMPWPRGLFLVFQGLISQVGSEGSAGEEVRMSPACCGGGAVAQPWARCRPAPSPAGPG